MRVLLHNTEYEYYPSLPFLKYSIIKETHAVQVIIMFTVNIKIPTLCCIVLTDPKNPYSGRIHQGLTLIIKIYIL